jgi:hypothetical protein
MFLSTAIDDVAGAAGVAHDGGILLPEAGEAGGLGEDVEGGGARTRTGGVHEVVEDGVFVVDVQRARDGDAEEGEVGVRADDERGIPDAPDGGVPAAGPQELPTSGPRTAPGKWTRM